MGFLRSGFSTKAGTSGSGRLEHQRLLSRVPSITTENGRKNETLVRERACSAYASTTCIPCALGSGGFRSRKTDEAHVERVDIFLTMGSSLMSRGRCPCLLLGRAAPVPKYLHFRRPGLPVVIKLCGGSLPTVLLRGSAKKRVHVVASLPSVPVAERAARVPNRASLGLQPRVARTVLVSTFPQCILTVAGTNPGKDRITIQAATCLLFLPVISRSPRVLAGQLRHDSTMRTS